MACGDVTSLCLQAWEGTPATAIAASALFAAVVEPPGARHRIFPRAATALTVVAAVLFIASGALMATGLALIAMLALAAALASAATAVWWLRGPAYDDSGGHGGRGPDVAPPGPSGGGVDWDAFERDFAAYVDARSCVPVA